MIIPNVPRSLKVPRTRGTLAAVVPPFRPARSTIGPVAAEEESFKVTDRRGRSDPATPSPERAHAPEPVDPEPESASVEADEAETPSEPDLRGLFMMLASSAVINLGEAADPVTGERRLDIGQAQEAIDLLLLLRSRTEGNRTELESQFLEELLYDLQLRFVRATKKLRT